MADMSLCTGVVTTISNGAVVAKTGCLKKETCERYVEMFNVSPLKFHVIESMCEFRDSTQTVDSYIPIHKS